MRKLPTIEPTSGSDGEGGACEASTALVGVRAAGQALRPCAPPQREHGPPPSLESCLPDPLAKTSRPAQDFGA
jgi:hypothetical protein